MELKKSSARKGETIDLRVGLLGADAKQIGQPFLDFSIHPFL